LRKRREGRASKVLSLRVECEHGSVRKEKGELSVKMRKGVAIATWGKRPRRTGNPSFEHLGGRDENG